MFTDTLEALKHLLWPTRCASCEVLLDEPGALMCTECSHSIENAPEVPSPKNIDKACSLFVYDGAVRTLISKWKYHEDFAAQNAILSLLPQHLEKLHEFIPDNACIIPVPPHPRRLRERGFDPVWTFATRLTKVLKNADIPVSFRDDVLIRTRHTVRQASLSEDERKHNLDGAFKVRSKPDSEKIILIDDVMTTGTTGSVCAATLRKLASSQWIALITLAHPLGSQHDK